MTPEINVGGSGLNWTRQTVFALQDGETHPLVFMQAYVGWGLGPRFKRHLESYACGGAHIRPCGGWRVRGDRGHADQLERLAFDPRPDDHRLLVPA